MKQGLPEFRLGKLNDAEYRHMKLMKFIIITFSVTILIYLVFPTCQELRPATFERDNIITRF